MSQSRQVRSAARLGWIFPVLLFMAGILQGCGGDELFQVQEGAAFARQPDPVAGGARVYLYWPARERSAWKEVRFYTGAAMEVLRPGGYVEAVVGPGLQQLEASQDFQVNDSTNASLHLAGLALEAQAGRTYYVRVGPAPRSLALGIEMRPVEAEMALPEIQKCRRIMVVWPQLAPR